MAVDDPLVAVATALGLERPGVGAGVVGLGHREARLHLDPSISGSSHFSLLLLGAVLDQDRLVARVGCDHAEQRRRPMA